MHAGSWIAAIEAENKSFARKIARLRNIATGELSSDAESVSSLSVSISSFLSPKRLAPLSEKIRHIFSAEEMVLGSLTIPELEVPKRQPRKRKPSSKIPQS